MLPSKRPRHIQYNFSCIGAWAPMHVHTQGQHLSTIVYNSKPHTHTLDDLQNALKCCENYAILSAMYLSYSAARLCIKQKGVYTHSHFSD